MAKKSVETEVLDPATNGAAQIIDASAPYAVRVTIEGLAPFLFHAWDCDAVEGKAKAAKGSKAKKSDNHESYVVRDGDGWIAIPGEYFRQSLIHAAKYLQDPRSPRKSAMDLFKAGLIVLTEHASVGKRQWDYLDRRRVVIQRNAITRERPALMKGWTVTFDVQVILPEYITREVLLRAMSEAGRLIGVGDFRPTFGRFSVTNVKDIHQ